MNYNQNIIPTEVIEDIVVSSMAGICDSSLNARIKFALYLMFAPKKLFKEFEKKIKKIR